MQSTRVAYMPIEERLAAGLERKPNGCLEWTGATNDCGYGRISFHGRPMRTHRLAWILANGPIPDGMGVLHHCDNPPCCDVEKCLFLGTQAVNLGDMAAKGRAVGWNKAKTHCPQNHAYDEANTYVRPDGGRDCRSCETSRRASRVRVYLYEPVECPDCGKTLGANNLTVHARRFHL